MTENAPTPTGPPDRVWQLTTWLLHHAGARANRIISNYLDKPGERMRYSVLAALDEFGGISQAELCRRLGIDPGDAVSTLNGMEADGLLVRQPHPSDRRRNALYMTEAGKARLLELDVLVEAAQDDLLIDLSPAERRQINTLLHRLLDIPPPSVTR